MSLPEWNTKEARESLTKRFYNLTPAEFEQRVISGKMDFARNDRMFKTLMLWYPNLK